MERDDFNKSEPVISDFDELQKEDGYEEHMKKVEKVHAEATPEQIEKFNKFVDFLNRDMLVKKDLVELAPEDAESTEEYSDRLYEGFKSVKFNIDKMMEDFFQDEAMEKRLKEIRKDIIESSGSKRALADVYKNDFAGMSPDFVEEVSKNAWGYATFYAAYGLGSKAKTLNEMLHLMHSAVVNNDNVLKSLPVIESDGENVKLYGTSETRNPVAEEVFEGLKGNPSEIDIVSLRNRTLMMVRDRGHALTIDIQKDLDEKYYVSYFIPKICNVDKVNLLPGVRQVQKKEGVNQVFDSTTGVFRVDDEAEVRQKVLDFISKVPADEDIVHEPDYYS